MAEPEARSLDEIRVLARVKPAERGAIARLCRWKRYRPHEQIIDRQSDSRDVFLVVEGKVRVVIYSLSGREIALEDIGAGGCFGELAAIDSEPRSASVMALTDTLVASMPPEHFLTLIRDHPEIAIELMRRLSHVIRQSTARIMDLSTLAANNRVQAELLRLARAAAGEGARSAVIRPIPVHSDIAGRVSTTRETVARVLNDLARHDIVRREKGALHVLDVARLEEMVEKVRGE
ncbi:MAG: Crp/Fnr family transcriptional regulator [Proteobacteria bacterium]|nr:Crp/Fnr family transcriptional regulator [Pseudomonadota bacterium]